MSGLSRRELLRRLAGCVAGAGTVVMARAVLAAAGAPPSAAPAGPEERADRLAEALPPTPEGTELAAFVNQAFRNAGGGGGGFANRGFANGGGFRNGAFANGAFRNGGFVNGAFRNGAFRNL
jgi:dienelactone hydrolase